MPTSSLTDILSVVEEVRRERLLELDPSLLKAIIEIEEAHTDDDHAAQRLIERAVAEVLRAEEGR